MAKRRANGEGSIRKRKDGRWEGHYSAGFTPGTYAHVTTQAQHQAAMQIQEKSKESHRFPRETVTLWLRG